MESPCSFYISSGPGNVNQISAGRCRMTRKTLFLSRFQYLNISFQISRTFCFIHKQFINLRTNIIVGPPMNDHEAALQYILNSNRTFGNVNSHSVSIFHFRDSRDTIGAGPSSPCGTQRRAGGKPSIRFPPETLVKYKRSLFQSIIICIFCFNCDWAIQDNFWKNTDFGAGNVSWPSNEHLSAARDHHFTYNFLWYSTQKKPYWHNVELQESIRGMWDDFFFNFHFRASRAWIDAGPSPPSGPLTAAILCRAGGGLSTRFPLERLPESWKELHFLSSLFKASEPTPTKL